MEKEKNFNTVTELPTTLASEKQLSQLYTRYHWAGSFVNKRQVLEIGCGFGIGLKYFIQCNAEHVIGGDISHENVKIAQNLNSENKNLFITIMDAEKYNFEQKKFDVIVMFETIYYFNNYKELLKRLYCILNPGGKLLISTVNCDWPQFNRSPYSVYYPNKNEINKTLIDIGFNVNIFGGFPESNDSVLARTTRLIRIVAVKLKLIPQTMKGKEKLKRLFYGQLVKIPNHIENKMANLEMLQSINPKDNTDKYSFLYFESTK